MLKGDKMEQKKRSEIMLLQFKFKNHKSFYEETILDFIATQEKRHLETTIEVNGYNILPVIAVHGANASGKSNLLEALQYMFKMIKDSNRIDVNEELLVYPFIFSEKSKKKNSEYEISICLGEYEYRYGFSLNKNGFDEEWLYKKKFSKTSQASQKVIFERNRQTVSFGSQYSQYEKIWEVFGSTGNTDKLLVLTNVAIKEKSGVLREIYDYVCKYYFKIEYALNDSTVIKILGEKNALYKEFCDILKEFDPCLLGIEAEYTGNISGEKKLVLYGVHQNIDNGEKILIPLHLESAGTFKIISILPMILKNLEVGGLLCIDELDIKFHPLLFKKIVSMYTDRNINKNNAQLVFTSHSTFLFNSDNLRRDEIYLVDKDNLGKSQLYSLSEFRNLRIDADYEKKYFAGQFGAIPYKNE